MLDERPCNGPHLAEDLGAPPGETAVVLQFQVQQDGADQQRRERDDQHDRVDVQRLLLHRLIS